MAIPQGSATKGCADFSASYCCTVQVHPCCSKLLSVCRDAGWQLSDHSDWDVETGGVGSQPCHPEAPAVSPAGRSLLDTLIRLRALWEQLEGLMGPVQDLLPLTQALCSPAASDGSAGCLLRNLAPNS